MICAQFVTSRQENAYNAQTGNLQMKTKGLPMQFLLMDIVMKKDVQQIVITVITIHKMMSQNAYGAETDTL